MDGNVGLFLLSYLLVVVAIYSIGMLLTSVSPNMKTANLLCTLIYFPMLFFSGATIPYEIMPKGVRYVMDVLPLTQGVKLLKATSLGLPVEHAILSIVILVAVSVLCIMISIKCFRWE